MKLTHSMLHKAASNYVGWNKTQAQLLGLKWPLEKGWLSSLIGKQIPDETWEKVLAVRGLKPKERRKLLKLEKEPTLL